MAMIDSAEKQTQTTATMQPFTLQPTLSERIWGTHDLSPWHPNPTSGNAIGEIWLTDESCKVASGPLAGSTLAHLTETSPELLGDPGHNGFPLLIKLLFPREKLSVQVHPNDAEAQALGMPRGKTECWYVVSAEPGAQLYLGFKEPISKQQMKEAIEDGTLESKLRTLTVKPGDMVFVDAGTIHAIGPGMVVLETQQYSDTTYRLWDYGRPRELHVDAGTAVTRSETAAGLVAPQPMDGFTRLIASQYFVVDRFVLGGAPATELGEAGKLQILIALDNGCSVQAAEGEAVPVQRAQALVLPSTATAYRLQGPADAQVVRILQP